MQSIDKLEPTLFSSVFYLSIQIVLSKDGCVYVWVSYTMLVCVAEHFGLLDVQENKHSVGIAAC